MFTKLLFLLFAVTFLASVSHAMPTDHGTGDCASCHKLTAKEAEELLKKLGGSVESVRQAPARGLFELVVEKDGKQGIIYIDYAKKHLLQGIIVDLETLSKVTAHEDLSHRMKQAASLDPKTIPVEYALVMGNPHGSKKLYVFLDPECPYCAEMYTELVKLEKSAPEVAIYILLYPLPAHPTAYDKSRSIMDSRDRTRLEKVFAGQKILIPGKNDGAKQLDEVIRFARRNDIVATPTTVMPDGGIVTGFKNAEELKKLLEAAK